MSGPETTPERGPEPPDAPAATPGPGLRALALRASVLTVLGVAGRSGLRLATNVVMARLLFPEVFGVMALVNIFVQAMQLFTDIGIGPSIIQSRRSDDPRFLATAWTMQIARGGLIWAVLLVVAWPAAWFYGEPQLATLIPVAGLAAVASGFGSTSIFTLNKELALGRLTALELGAQAAAIPVMVAWASVHPSAWALVAGSVASATVRAVWSHRLDARRDRLGWDADVAREVLSFGKWIFATTLVGFLASQVDRILLGRLVPMEVLGVYAIAFMFHQIPDSVLGALGYRVLFPAISRRIDLPRPRLREAVRANRWPLAAALAVGVATLASVGDVVVHLFYDDRYREAGWMLQILALGLWPRMLVNTVGPALLAIGQPRWITYSTVVRFAFLAAAVPLGHAHAGMLGVATAVALAGTADYVVENMGLGREGLRLGAQDLWLTGLWLGTLAVVGSARWLLTGVVTEAPLPW